MVDSKIITLASVGMSSTFRIQGIGPNPIENAVMNSIKLTRGRNPILSTVSFEMKLSGSIVVAVVVIIIVVVVLLLPESLHSSPHCSYKRKNTPTPIIEMQMKRSEMMRRTFRPNFSIIIVVTKVPSTWTAPISMALVHSSIEVPAFCFKLYI